MSRRFTVVSLALIAVIGFLVGAIVAGGVSRSSVSAGAPARRASAEHSVGPARAVPGPLVDFADVVARINQAVVNIDATSRAPEGRRRRGGSLMPDPPDLFDDPPGFGPNGGSPRRG